MPNERHVCAEHTIYVLSADISIRLAHIKYLHKHILTAIKPRIVFTVLLYINVLSEYDKCYHARGITSNIQIL
jgi:hypothetical protein